MPSPRPHPDKPTVRRLDTTDPFIAALLQALTTRQEDARRALARAQRLAVQRPERQQAAIVAAFVEGMSDRAHVLCREHLSEHPNDVLVNWLETRGPGPDHPESDADRSDPAGPVS